MSSHLPDISRSMWWDLAVPIGVATALDVAASNASYLYLSVSLYTIVKSSNLIFTLLFSILYYLREPSSLLFASVFIIVVGMVLFSSGSIMFSWIGFFLVLGASAISGFRWSLTEVLMRQLGCRLHAMLTIYLISPASAVVLVPLSLLMELPRYLDSQFSQNPFLLFLCLVNVVVGGLFAFAMILVELELLRRTSCLTISVISYAKMFSQIILSVLIFHDIISLSSWIGIFLTIVGMFCYSMSSRENDSRPMYVVQKSEDNEECESSVSTLSDQLPPADEEI